MPESDGPFAHLLQRLRRVLQPRPASFSSRLAYSVVLLVILTILFGALPAVIAIYLQLNGQIEARIQQAQLATQTLYETERQRLLDLTLFIAERPTLCRLTQNGEREALIPYLEQVRQGAPIDTLAVMVAGQPPVLSGVRVQLNPESLRAGRSLPFADYIAQEEPAELLLVAASEINPSGECTNDPQGWVMAIRSMNHQDMRSMAQHTGLEQSLIVAGHRAATSLPNAPDWPLDPQAAEIVQRTLTSCCTTSAHQKEVYYLGLAPLFDQQGQLVALSEVALPGNAIQRAARSSIALLFGSSVLIAAISAVAALVLTNRITHPLRSLAEAAARFGQGDLEQPISTQSDWTEINQLADQLEVSRRHLQRIFQVNRREMKQIMRMLSAIREGMVRLTPEGLITYINPDGERILGLRADRILRRHYSQVFRPAPGAVTTLSDILQPAPGQPPPRHLIILDANDQPLTLSVVASWPENAEALDGPSECLLMFCDAGEDVALNQLRSEFLANLAHEFRTPLSSIAASIELLSEEGSSMSREELEELTNTASLATRHLQTLIDNLLESAIIEAGFFSLRCHPILLRDVIRYAVEILSPLLNRRKQKLEIEAPKEFLTILADPDRLCQAVVNLLDNASKYSPFGGTIYLTFKRQGDELFCEVLDSGPGIPPERQKELFKRYTSFTDLQGAHQGFGLGLSVVRTIIEAHGGRVGANNRPEGGARFWFTLPLKPRSNHRGPNDQDSDRR